MYQLPVLARLLAPFLKLIPGSAGWRPKRIAGRYYNLGGAGNHAATGGSAGSIIYFVPFILYETITVDRLVARVTTAVASSNFKLSIYGSNPTTLRPTGEPLIQSAAMSGASAAVVESGDLTPAVLTPGLYYFGTNVDDTGATGNLAFFGPAGASGYGTQMLGASSAANLMSSSSVSAMAYQVSHDYDDALPDVTAASFTEQPSARGAMPAVRLAA